MGEDKNAMRAVRGWWLSAAPEDRRIELGLFACDVVALVVARVAMRMPWAWVIGLGCYAAFMLAHIVALAPRRSLGGAEKKE